NLKVLDAGRIAVAQVIPGGDFDSVDRVELIPAELNDRKSVRGGIGHPTAAIVTKHRIGGVRTVVTEVVNRATVRDQRRRLTQGRVRLAEERNDRVESAERDRLESPQNGGGRTAVIARDD